MEKRRRIIYFQNYFIDFFNGQSERIKDKIDYVLFLVNVSERIPKRFFKYLKGTKGLYEIRIEYGGNIYRIFCCIDEGDIMVLFNGFQKKSEKTPLQEIKKAMKIKKAYFNLKNRKT